MPRISKIRLTGCKYEGMEKEHEDSIFDLTKDGSPDHSLFTLANGCGKGVMMQLISQVLLPNTRWGKNNGNKIISMFYDKRNNLHQFTFHVVLEWVLDTIPQKNLVTGIAVKSVIRDTDDADNEKSGLHYFLYTHEYENDGYGIEDLPLYNNENKETIDIDDLEDFIDKNKRDFIKYSKSSVRRRDSEYFRYLESRGIYRSEWVNLKRINRTEAGSGGYFTGATDNKSIFDKVIIPAISENINNYTDDNDNLIDMFKSNLSITRNLPILLEREGGLKLLIEEIKPLIQNADSGRRFIEMKDRILSEGNDIHFILNDQENLIIEEVDKWTKEKIRTKQEKENLEFEKDNIKYNKEKKELEEKQVKKELIDKLYKEKIIKIDKYEEEKLKYRISEVLFYKKENEKKFDMKTKEKVRLMKTINISDIEEKIDTLEGEIKEEWIKSKGNWISIENQFLEYRNYTQEILERDKIENQRYKKEIDSLQNDINKFELKEEELYKKRSKLEEDFIENELLYPVQTLEELKEEKEKRETKETELIESKREYNKELEAINNELLRFEYDLKDKNKEIENLQIKLKEQEKYELEVGKMLTGILFEQFPGGLMDHRWFAERLETLEKKENSTRCSLEVIQRSIWEKNIDVLLNKEDYLIPNKDIIKIKEEIEKMDIHVETGSEYLSRLKKDEKQEILKYNPAFLYSLVIANQKEWKLIEKNINKELIINNMVPIYIRSEQELTYDNRFRVIIGKTYNLLDKDTYINWKTGLLDEINKLVDNENKIKNDLEKISDIKLYLKTIINTDTALVLNRKLKDHQEEFLTMEDTVRSKEKVKQNIDKKIKDIEFLLEENTFNLKTTDELIKKLQEFIGLLEALDLEKVKALENKEIISRLRKKICDIEERNEKTEDDRMKIEIEFKGWKLEIKKLTSRVRLVLKDIEYKNIAENRGASAKIPDFRTSEMRLNQLMDERDLLEKDINARESKLSGLSVELEYIKENLDKNTEDLEKLDVNWKDREHINLAVSEIEMIIESIGGEIKKLVKEKDELKSELDGLKGSIETAKEMLERIAKQIQKTHERAPSLLETGNTQEDINRVESDIRSNIAYSEVCAEELEKNKEFRIKLEANISKLKNQFDLDLARGKMNNSVQEKIKGDINLAIDDWIRKIKDNERKIKETLKEGEDYRRKFIKTVELSVGEERLRNQAISTLKNMNILKFENNLETLTSMEIHFQNELSQTASDKEKAEDAMKRWTERASIHVIKIIQALKNMVNSMTYINEQDYVFPLVKLKGVERLPKKESDIKHLLEEYFVETISKLLKDHKDSVDLADIELKGIMDDHIIFSKALRGRYPTLLVYKMSEKNEFQYARARDEHYTTWEAINKGEGYAPEGSGGQSLSINTFVIMMIMSFKKKHIGNENPSTVLILDNPFGEASGRHVLDPIFEISSKLNFQLICFAPPELIKVEISERFPVFWELKIEDGKVVHGGRIIKETTLNI